MRAAGVDATLIEIAGGFHGFILLPAPESKKARRQIQRDVESDHTVPPLGNPGAAQRAADRRGSHVVPAVRGRTLEMR